jgi:hypothetical protein
VFLELSQLLVVGGEESGAAAVRITVHMLDDKPFDREAVVGRDPAADFIEDDAPDAVARHPFSASRGPAQRA